MAFLFQDQNQGTRNETAPRKGAAAATVLFHPDYNRRLRNHTESADPSSQGTSKWKFPGEAGARGLGRRHPYRRWGFSPRPENIGRPEWTTCRELWRITGGPARTLAPGNLHVPMTPEQSPRRKPRKKSRLRRISVARLNLHKS